MPDLEVGCLAELRRVRHPPACRVRATVAWPVRRVSVQAVVPRSPVARLSGAPPRTHDRALAGPAPAVENGCSADPAPAVDRASRVRDHPVHPGPGSSAGPPLLGDLQRHASVARAAVPLCGHGPRDRTLGHAAPIMADLASNGDGCLFSPAPRRSPLARAGVSLVRGSRRTGGNHPGIPCRRRNPTPALAYWSWRWARGRRASSGAPGRTSPVGPAEREPHLQDAPGAPAHSASDTPAFPPVGLTEPNRWAPATVPVLLAASCDRPDHSWLGSR